MSEQFMSICLGLDVSSTLLRLPSTIYNSSSTAIVLSVQSSKCICTEYSTLKTNKTCLFPVEWVCDWMLGFAVLLFVSFCQGTGPG